MIARGQVCVRSHDMTTAAHDPSPIPAPDGLSLAPFRGLRPQVDSARLAAMLCPPYDVIDERLRTALLAADPDNAVAVVLPEPTEQGYAGAARRLEQWVHSGLFVDRPDPAAVRVRDARARRARRPEDCWARWSCAIPPTTSSCRTRTPWRGRSRTGWP